MSHVIEQLCEAMDQFLFSSDILVLAEAIIDIPDCRTLNNTAQPQPSQTMKDTPSSLMVDQISVLSTLGQIKISPGSRQVDGIVTMGP